MDDTADRNASDSGRGSMKLLAVAAAVIVIAAGGAVTLLAAGGTVAITVNMEGDDMIMVNGSHGIFNGYEWEVTDDSGQTVFRKTVSDRGTIVWRCAGGMDYEITMTARTILGSDRKVTCSFGSYTVSWDSYSVNVSMSSDDYESYSNYGEHVLRSDRFSRWPGGTLDSSMLNVFMRTDTRSGVFDDVIEQLRAQSPGGTVEDGMNYLMGFVQNLNGSETYKADISPEGPGNTFDRWNFPIETLYNRGGDCEDLAILLLALSMDFFDDVRLAMVVFWGTDGRVDGHALAAVGLDAPPSPSSGKGSMQTIVPEYIIGGITYYTCETVSQGWDVGRIQDEYRGLQPDMVVTV